MANNETIVLAFGGWLIPIDFKKPCSNSTPDVNEYDVRLKKDLQDDILSNTEYWVS